VDDEVAGGGIDGGVDRAAFIPMTGTVRVIALLFGEWRVDVREAAAPGKMSPVKRWAQPRTSPSV